MPQRIRGWPVQPIGAEVPGRRCPFEETACEAMSLDMLRPELGMRKKTGPRRLTSGPVAEPSLMSTFHNLSRGGQERSLWIHSTEGLERDYDRPITFRLVHRGHRCHHRRSHRGGYRRPSRHDRRSVHPRDQKIGHLAHPCDYA